MFTIDFDADLAFDRTADYIENAGAQLTGELIVAVGGFYDKLGEVFQQINSYFE